ncbi:acyl-CoA dehydrogenase [Neptunicoccus cionae]|uniref:acyl-CoA dehydrogenase n=1 Tax=Neptunicoccus cionae TaxID=2035344 RepID=UPI000C7938A6|nr:acyl-CoA dehydrogenase [Amylibacter cionae]PLS23289.1 acyl-CoA dehydrogenase [Amylibacter cionae]
MPYTAPTDEHLHLLRNVLGYDRISSTEKFEDAGDDMIAAILSEAGKMAQDVLAPLQRPGDLEPAHLENGVVRTAPGFHDGYKAIAEGGWVGAAADPEHGGMGLPLTITTLVGEMMASACLSLSLNPLMTQGQIEALEAHGSDAIKALYLPKLISGEWTGTMNLTEPQAGSDVGALRSKAVDNGDGTFAISGQKIYISWGDHDFGGNVCHLVLARLPDGVPGTKGISLFIVPKFIPDADGNLGEANSLRVVSLEHKLGLHGSPTAVMEFDGATGWMVGPPHGGMAAMFTMMNNARLGVGTEGLGVAEAAYQKALEFALERKQGKTPVDGGTGTIADHADVRRMLLTMKAQTAVARAIILDTAISTDLFNATQDASFKARAAFLTPIAKAFGTDTGSEVADLGIQVHGGMGFVEETGAAQFSRDVRVTRIYEGTNGIQAMDLVGRKLMDGGDAAFAMLDEIAATAKGNEALAKAETTLRETTKALLASDINARFAGATSFLRAFAITLGGHYLTRGADTENRRALNAFYTAHFLPQVDALCAAATAGDALLYALDTDALAG